MIAADSELSCGNFGSVPDDDLVVGSHAPCVRRRGRPTAPNPAYNSLVRFNALILKCPSGGCKFGSAYNNDAIVMGIASCEWKLSKIDSVTFELCYYVGSYCALTRAVPCVALEFTRSSFLPHHYIEILSGFQLLSGRSCWAWLVSQKFDKRKLAQLALSPAELDGVLSHSAANSFFELRRICMPTSRHISCRDVVPDNPTRHDLVKFVALCGGEGRGDGQSIQCRKTVLDIPGACRRKLDNCIHDNTAHPQINKLKKKVRPDPFGECHSF